MKLKDLSGIFKTHDLTFISSENIANDYYVITLEKPKILSYKAGEHGIFTLPGQKFKGKKFRAFSIASSDKESKLILGTRTGKNMSSYKQTLINLKKGDIVKLRGPFGWFYEQDQETPMVFIALGVGITPFRALLKDMESSKKPVELIYSSMDTYMFNEELDVLAKEHDNYHIIYTKDIFSTQDKIKEKISTYGNKAYYYISGSTKAIKATKKLLKSNGIKRKRMINDPFFGY
jgi:ferredoxin-NADP reductase